MTTVTLLTEQQGFAQKWERVLSEHGFDSRVVPGDNLAQAAQPNTAVIVDAVTRYSKREDLLKVLGFLRASGAVPAVQLGGDNGATTSVLDELCTGLIARDDHDIEGVAERLAHRIDPSHRHRLQMVTVSPGGNSVVAIFGNGEAAFYKRPLGDNDDGTAITHIELSADGTSATLRLQSGALCDISAARPSNGNGNGAALDGEKLGARLKAFRLAAGLTQAELARRTGIHRPNIARVEAGRHTPSLETLSRIANAIGVSPTEVLAAD